MINKKYRYELEMLYNNGLNDICIQMALQNTYPSYGYEIDGVGNDEPATTLWELWNSDVAGPGMNSRNHIMFGSVSSWFYKSLAGIMPLKSGYSLVKIAPFTNSSNLSFVTS